MPRTNDIPAEAEQRLRILLHQAKQSAQIKRIQSVYFRVKYSLSPEEIADMVGYHPDYVRDLQARYFRDGEQVFTIKQKGGRHRQNLSLQQEEQLLLKFAQKAKTGQILQVKQITDAYEKQAGKSVPKSTIYRMLARHGWRKVTPRPKHPKNNPSDVEAFKKTFQAL